MRNVATWRKARIIRSTPSEPPYLIGLEIWVRADSQKTTRGVGALGGNTASAPRSTYETSLYHNNNRIRVAAESIDLLDEFTDNPPATDLASVFRAH